MSQKPPPIPTSLTGNGGGTGRPPRRDPRGRWPFIFAGVLAVVALVVGTSLQLGMHQRLRGKRLQAGSSTWDEATAEVSELGRRQHEHYQETGETSSGIVLNRMVTAYERAAQGDSVEARTAGLMAEYARELQKASQPLEDAVNRVREAGRIDPETFTSPQALKERVELFEAMDRETQRFLSFYEDRPRWMEEAARRRGFSDNDWRTMSPFVMQGLRLKQHREYRTQVSEFARAAAEYTRFLHEHWGKWRYDEAEFEIVFDENAPVNVAARHAELKAALHAADERLNELETAWMDGAQKFREEQRAKRGR